MILMGCVLVFVALKLYGDHPEKGIESFLRTIESFLIRSSAYPADSENYIECIVKRALMEGVGVEDRLQQLYHHVFVVRRSLRKSASILHLFVWRFVSGFVLIVLARITIRGFSTRADYLDFDLILMCLASAVVSLSFYAFNRLRPKHWFWQRGLSSDARAWIEWLFFDESSIEFHLSRDLKRMLRHQSISGKSTLENRHKTLCNWAEKESLDYDRSCELCLEWLPLIELVGIGGAGVLLLLVPCLNGLAV